MELCGAGAGGHLRGLLLERGVPRVPDGSAGAKKAMARYSYQQAPDAVRGAVRRFGGAPR
jgi:hypothetical protein